MKNLVIVDLGSNSVRMAINSITDEGTFREIRRVKEDSRISEGMGRERLLRPQAINRTIEALHRFKEIYEEYPRIEVRGITTAAVRMARNQKDFLKRVQRETGIKLEVLSGDDEAYYDYLGVINSLEVKDCLVLDTGGASCELIDVHNGKARNMISIPIGAVSLSERFHLSNVIRGDNLFSAEMFVNKQLRDVWWIMDAFNKPVVLLGGTNRTLARINRCRQKIARVNNIHGYRLKTEVINRTFRSLITRNLENRKKIAGLETARADIIVGGVLPLVMLLQMIDSDRVIFSESGVREGIISEYINQHVKGVNL
ncbi:Ppx/GppA family phosphatase [Pediococcus acidilactici]|uniref:Ppx/GppA family phosphatase n=1 Tax=Pediococcus acidilactici TaxID=1254 RepID=UPI000326F08E|nr:Ppx/GppA family phosphatase [Pediococcus acidilactici]EOA07870.1 exopolyphosphatase, ppx [Pediococcus acidilactici D3]MBW4797851.1 Ppx/GppA family phosphatase [Pediococcus acidilactici]MBW9307224.1 Ppx/GppA family phosphatase [Pediococcus acidilactici]MCE5962750.1 Ppx/GppA family phosphatase [Pediococcus acidilactici]MDB8857985.1 Ppx/GppA family phosphatase [Pediococcus acidilactici]